MNIAQKQERSANPAPASRKNYHLGSLYAVVTALLFATQEPFSALAAKRLTPLQFVFLTQTALLLAVPLFTIRAASRRDLKTLLLDVSNYGKLAILFGIGLSGLLLYKLGLSNAHPIIISAILNLSPFWAALVALLISKKAIPVSPMIFFGCLAAAFVGAMAVAWSQIGDAEKGSVGALVDNILHGSWIYAFPIPILTALSGTLIGKWFVKYDPAAAVAANFILSGLIIAPASFVILYSRSELQSDQYLAIALMVIGTIVAAALGRVLYQIALAATDNDNGFVTMFFLLVPALTSLISLPMSWWIQDLHFFAGPAFFAGLSAIAVSLLLFSLKSWR
jgi:drug/metabolite transporter (DMT)-like permease